MERFDPQLLAAWTAGTWVGDPRALTLAGFTIDSRRAATGEMFVALKTEQRDGHAYLADAQAAGAAAALVSVAQPERVGDNALGLPQLVVRDTLAAFQAIAREHRRRFAGPVIGVTGSAGKTSTKELLALLLGSETLATEGNLNNHLGVPLTLTRLDPARHRFAVIEAGISAPGEMKVLADMIEPDAAIVTMVGPAHLEELGGLEGVAREKALLAQAIRPGGVAIFPPSCREFAAFRGVRTHLPPWGVKIRPAGEGMHIWLAGDTSGEPYVLPAPSEGMAQNAALALLIALHFGVPDRDLRARLARWRPAAQRGEIRREGGRLLYLDYYNANPLSMRDALAAFERLAPPPAPRLFLLGCMEELGGGAERYHRELGEGLALTAADRVIVVGDWAEAVKAGALARGARAEQILACAVAADAVPIVEGFAGPIFVKGSRKHRLETALRLGTPQPTPC
jgi:UDP-N-acetylmuramoyl-tripeptide--D-alanyl-D-alanine ligase